MQALKALKSNIADARMLTLSEAATLLGLKPVTLRAWAARRKIAVHRLGRAIRISAHEVERLIEESLVPAAHNSRP